MRTILAMAFVAAAAVGAGADEWQVTTADANSAHPTWCGSYIALQSDRVTGTFQIWGVNESGSSRAWSITNQPWRTFTEPHWNCDAHVVAFQGRHGSGPDTLWSVWDSGSPQSTPIDLTVGAGDDEAPNDRLGTIAFHSDRAGQDDIYIMPEGGEGGGITRLTTSPAADLFPAISPDGQWIAFASDRAGDFDIWITGPGGEADTLRHVTAGSGRYSEPAWSPGGTHIAFARGSVGIVVVEVASRAEYEVTSNGTDSSPAWSPEGDIIAFTRHGAHDQIWCSDNVPPGTGVERTSWGSIKALYR